ncbi:MAG: hypothetical protein FWC39_00425 [Bacteroidetes bacterium]|nr:hypothetical protein [Bacteroidota bacterium]
MKQYKISKETQNLVQEPAVAYERTVRYAEPVQREEEVLTYEIIQRKKREQQRLIDFGLMEKPQIKWGFSPEQRAEFDRGITIEDIFRKYNIPL